MKLILVTVVILIVLMSSILSTKAFLDPISKSAPNSSILIRQKRFFPLIFTNGGQVRYILGYLGPIDIPLWANINCARNLQFQYDLPPRIVTIYNKFKTRNFKGSAGAITGDETRRTAYDIMEYILNKDGVNGHECILRTICEVAETPLHHNGLIGELLNIFFTPGDHEKVDDDYKFAKDAGKYGADCLKMYPECPFGDGILDSVSLFHYFKFSSLLTRI